MHLCKRKTRIICSKDLRTENTSDLINDTKYIELVRYSEQFEGLLRNVDRLCSL
jgi:hypothetical protein